MDPGRNNCSNTPDVLLCLLFQLDTDKLLDSLKLRILLLFVFFYLFLEEVKLRNGVLLHIQVLLPDARLTM